MADVILHHNGAYNIYTTVVDKCRFEKALSYDKLKAFFLERHGKSGLLASYERINRARLKGTSSIYSESLEDEISYNHAGENDSTLSLDEFIKQYLTLPYDIIDGCELHISSSSNLKKNTQLTITISCCLCSNSHRTTFLIPAGWDIDTFCSLDYENGFCPEHSIIKQWVESQCPGCVGGWPACSLWRTFAYGRIRWLKDSDLNQIRKGVCPKRINGTIEAATASGVQDLDLSETAPIESGEAFAKAILEYWWKYPIEIEDYKK